MKPFYFNIKHLLRQSDQGVEYNRLLERNLRQSNFLDFESLCIRSAEKVWQIRVDLNVLNNDGNILDCANIALICSISHYRLPDVSVSGDEIRIVLIHFSKSKLRMILILFYCHHLVFPRRTKSSSINDFTHTIDNYFCLF